jgi:predicted  nucleic acid-binding Zn-ribbon protein
MEAAIVPAWTDLSSFKTPLRVLAQHFLASRERWKAKYMAIKEQASRYRRQLRDLRDSREHWKRKAKALERELAQGRRAYRKERAVVESCPPCADGSPPARNSRFAPPLGQS